MPKLTHSQLPPHNQRRLNKILNEQYANKYCDWYAWALELQMAGCTYLQIAFECSKLGVQISQFTIRDWMIAKQNNCAT